MNNGWRSMDSAPKDGTSVLLWLGSSAWCGWWHNSEGDTDDGKPGWVDGSRTRYEKYYVMHPTAWQPLPEGPTRERSGHE